MSSFGASFENKWRIISMPGSEHMKGVGKKYNRMYEHIKKSELKRGMPEQEAKKIAAMTTNKNRTMAGVTKKQKGK